MLETQQQSHDAHTSAAALECIGHRSCPQGLAGRQVCQLTFTCCLQLCPVQGHVGLHHSQLTSTYCLRKPGNSGPWDASLQGPGEAQECRPRSSMSAEARLCRQTGSPTQPGMQDGQHASARSPAQGHWVGSLQTVKDSEIRLWMQARMRCVRLLGAFSNQSGKLDSR